MLKELLKDAMANGTIADAETVVCLLDSFVRDVRGASVEYFDKEMNCLRVKMQLYNTKLPLDREQAEYAVSCMRNKDGTVGEHWTYEQTTEVLRQKGYQFRDCDWYFVLNMKYSDYYVGNANADYYIGLAKDFLSDTDAPSNWAKRYWIAAHPCA